MANDQQVDASLISELPEGAGEDVDPVPWAQAPDEADHDLMFEPLIVCRAVRRKHIRVDAIADDLDLVARYTQGEQLVAQLLRVGDDAGRGVECRLFESVCSLLQRLPPILLALPCKRRMRVQDMTDSHAFRDDPAGYPKRAVALEQQIGPIAGKHVAERCFDRNVVPNVAERVGHTNPAAIPA